MFREQRKEHLIEHSSEADLNESVALEPHGASPEAASGAPDADALADIVRQATEARCGFVSAPSSDLTVVQALAPTTSAPSKATQLKNYAAALSTYAVLFYTTAIYIVTAGFGYGALMGVPEPIRAKGVIIVFQFIWVALINNMLSTPPITLALREPMWLFFYALLAIHFVAAYLLAKRALPLPVRIIGCTAVLANVALCVFPILPALVFITAQRFRGGLWQLALLSLFCLATYFAPGIIQPLRDFFSEPALRSIMLPAGVIIAIVFLWRSSKQN